MSEAWFGSDGQWVLTDDMSARGWARILDTVIFASFGVILPAITAAVLRPGLTAMTVFLGLGSALAIMVVLETGCLAKTGATPAKALFALRVAPTGQPGTLPSAGRAFARTALLYLGIAAGLLLARILNARTPFDAGFITWGVGLIPIAFGKPALHDTLTGLRTYAWQGKPRERTRPRNDPFALATSRARRDRL